MAENKEKKRQGKSKKEFVIPGHIKGKIDVPDTRERRDGPGGN